MDGIVLVLFTMLVGGIATLLWRRHRARRLRMRITYHRLRCPRHDGQADLAVQTDPGAQSCRQHVAVASCSLLPDAAVMLPERSGYLADFPPFKVLLEPARSSTVYATEVACPQHCLFVLNRAEMFGAPQPVTCMSGAGDAIDLAAHAVGNPRIAQLLWRGGA